VNDGIREKLAAEVNRREECLIYLTLTDIYLTLTD
jgi:hypothetical protein